MTERQRILALWSALGAYYQRPIDDLTLSMYAEDVADVPAEKIEEAMRKYRKNPVNRVPPLPAQIRALAQPETQPVSNKAQATEAAARIVSAIRKFGWNNQAEAQKFIGELGWRVIELQGGWLAQCESTDPTGVLQAQWTRLGEAILERGIAGLNQPPGLPQGDKPQQIGPGLSRIAELLPNGGKNGPAK